jgi:60 kDa SS-A/Ro ribonucleoprotein
VVKANVLAFCSQLQRKVKMSRALKTYANPSSIPQTEPLRKGTPQVKNNAGGYVYKLDPQAALRRFLMLGTDGGTYYVGERDLTKQNVDLLVNVWRDQPTETADTILKISDAGLAPKVSPALFALAMGMAGTPQARTAVEDIFPFVVRTASHLLEFVNYVNGLRGWGRSLKRTVSYWFQKDINTLGYQVLKYQNRNGWSHRDILRLTHPKSFELRSNLYAYLVGKPHKAETLPYVIAGYEAIKAAASEQEVIDLIAKHGFTHEMVPNQWKNSPAVWDAILHAGEHGMPLTAMIRNLATMTRVGLLGPFSEAQKYIVGKLGNQEALKRARIHPLNVLNALMAYSANSFAMQTSYYGSGNYGLRGKGLDGKTPNAAVVAALENAFYDTFQYAPRSGKSFLVAMDVSGSMTSQCGGMNMSCIHAETALASVILAQEPNSLAFRFDTSFKQVTLPVRNLARALEIVYDGNFGGTDCSLPMKWATKAKAKVDTFVVITDNETWAGNRHPSTALNDYRSKVNPDAKLVVIGMTATDFTIADPADRNSLDVVGFDASVPGLLANFAGGAL